jgi:hypothetical protein
LRDIGKAESAREQWLKDIDYVFSAIDAGKPVKDEELVCCGIGANRTSP